MSCTLDVYFQSVRAGEGDRRRGRVDGRDRGGEGLLLGFGAAWQILFGTGRALRRADHIRLAGLLQPDDDVLVVPGGDLVADLDLREPLHVRSGDGRHGRAIGLLERDRAGRRIDRLDDARLRLSSRTSASWPGPWPPVAPHNRSATARVPTTSCLMCAPRCAAGASAFGRTRSRSQSIRAGLKSRTDRLGRQFGEPCHGGDRPAGPSADLVPRVTPKLNCQIHKVWPAHRRSAEASRRRTHPICRRGSEIPWVRVKAVRESQSPRAQASSSFRDRTGWNCLPEPLRVPLAGRSAGSEGLTAEFPVTE